MFVSSPNASIASMVISAQVRQQGGVSSVLKQTPATIQFTFNSSAYDSNVRVHINQTLQVMYAMLIFILSGKVSLCVLAVRL